MTHIIAYLPSMFSNETKKVFIDGLLEIFEKECGYSKDQITVYIEEYSPDNVCVTGAEKMSITVFIESGHSDDKKEEMAKHFNQLCTDAFGEKRLGAFVTYEEHTLNNICYDGVLLSDK